MTQELVTVKRPQLPEHWDYAESVKKVKGFIYKWKNLTIEIAQELWIAREKLRSQGARTDLQPRNESFEVKTWTQYCEDTGSCKEVVNRWLRRFFPPELPEFPEPSPLPVGKYRVIYADPPWQYGDKLIEGYGAADHHYSTMSIKKLCEMPFPETEKNAVLFLWVTAPLLKECFEVIEAWGFEYKTQIVWNKKKHNFGFFISVRHENLLICTKGSCHPDIKELSNSVVSIERSRKHSEKPEYFRELIDKLYPKGKRIELFARKKTKENWDYWGTEV